jgi:hypothetical protein
MGCIAAMNKYISLSRDGLKVLLCVLEERHAQIIGYLLCHAFPDVADELLQDRWLVPYEMASFCKDKHTNHFMPVVQHDGSYGYFDQAHDWVPMPKRHVTRYQVNHDQLWQWLRAWLGIADHYRLTSIIPSRCWYLGVTHAEKYRVHVYFACQIRTLDARRALHDALHDDVGHTPAIILLGEPPVDNVVQWPLDRLLVPIARLLARVERCQLHKPALAALTRRLYGNTPLEESNEKQALNFSTDYRQVRWCGKTYRLTKTQAAVIKVLHRRSEPVHKDCLCHAASTCMPLSHIFRNKVGHRYTPHPLWQKLVVSDGNGYYRLSTDAS